MRIPRPVRVAALVALPAALLISCSATGGGEPDTGGTSTTAAAGEAQPAAGTRSSVEPSPGPELVRDAFAGLQATLGDGCTGGDGQCAYFLGRVHDELERLDEAMKADPKGPGHFPEPIEWIAELRRTLGQDTSYENLKTHQKELVGTRDRINVWMQDHPDDYR